MNEAEYYHIIICTAKIILEELAAAEIASPIGRRECGKILIEKKKEFFTHKVYMKAHTYTHIRKCS